MSAIISQCGKFRYRLERDVQMDGLTFAYFGINPSTADATLDDATVRKWIGFTKVNGGRRFIVGNVSAYRATDVKELADVLITPDQWRANLDQIGRIIEDANVLIPCWGNRSKAPKHMRNDFDTVLAMLQTSGKPVKHFGLTQSGDPKHPLMLGYDTKLIEWNRRAPASEGEQK
ncbi:DUF1643 domain-containing protein [Burkholderia vietnamiensis]|uniref:DUF1643 domain-containing protein n=1 Tax=Burkholderia vietnamiensis TaxID=60552 RepID=UPI001BA43547|nr:DUF1643 domain-containing protein [Burkholderia vietnamiensis]